MQTAMNELARLFADTADRVSPEQLDHPTPCSKYTVGQLLAHLGGVFPDSERAARKLAVPTTAEAPTAPAAVGESARRAAAAWGEPDAYEGTTEFGPGEIPAGFAAAITLQELALHGWDLARGIGSDYPLSDASAEAVLGVVEQLAEQVRATGGYGPAVAVPADAPVFERALAASGRNPGWEA
jgi:uncharacterized protein (TIGR03086 family)